jgi:hypothetical protein
MTPGKAGALPYFCYARVGKLFTASQDLMLSKVATLNHSHFTKIVELVIDLLRSSTEQLE